MSTPDKYEVGYGRPPKHSRFKPGNRANPRGRGKGTKNLKTDLQEELSEKITIGEGERRTKLSKQRAVVKSMVARAIKGDQRAADRCFELLLKFFGVGEDATRPVELSAEDESILAAFIARDKEGADQVGARQEGPNPGGKSGE